MCGPCGPTIPTEAVNGVKPLTPFLLASDVWAMRTCHLDCGGQRRNVADSLLRASDVWAMRTYHPDRALGRIV